HFADLVPASAAPDSAQGSIRDALSILDAAITLDSVSVAVSSFDQAEGAGDPLAALAQVTPDPGSTAPVPAPPALAATQIGRGLNVYGSIAFEGALWQAVKFVVDLTDATFSFYGRLDPQDPTKTMFQGELANATVLTYLHFETLKLKYQSRPPAPAPAPNSPPPPSTSADPAPAPAPYLALGGAGSLTLPGITDIDFTGWVVFETKADSNGESARSASFDASVSVTETSLLGIPRVTLALSSIRMAWTLGDRQSDWKRTEFAIVATATLGSFTFNAKVDLSDGTRQSIILSLETGHSLSLQHLLVDGLGATWLDGAVPDLSFSNGSLTWTKPTEGAATYALHAEASIIGLGFLFDATLTDGQGVTGSAALAAPIDFGFIKLAGPAKLNGPKATLTSNATEKSMALDSVVTLLDHDFTLHLAYSKPADSTEPVYTGSISTPIDFGSLGSIEPTLTLTYSDSGGLDVKLDSLGIPWEQVKQFIDFVQMVETATSGLESDPCKALGDLGLGSDAIKLSFDCALAFPHLTPQSQSTPTSIDIDLVVSYKIQLNVPGFNQVLREASMELGFLSIPIPAGGLTFSSIAQSLITALVNAGPNIIIALFSDPKAMKTFAEMLAAKAALSTLLSNLVCQQTEGPEADAEAELEAGAEAAASGAAEAAAAAFGAAFAITAGVIGFLESIWDSITGEDKRRKERAEDQQRRAVLGLANLLRPQSATLAFASSDTATLSCTPPAAVADGNGATYAFTLVRIPPGGGDPQPVTPRGSARAAVDWSKGDSAPSLSIAYDGLVPGGDYQLSVQALVSIDGLTFRGRKVTIGPRQTMGFDTVDGASDPVASATVRLPDCAVQSILLEQVGARVSATVVEGNEVAGSILLQWLGQDGQVTGADPAAPAFPGTAAGARHSFRIAPPAATGAFVLRATAAVGTVAYQTSSTALQVLDLAAPALAAPQFSRDRYAVAGAWSNVANAGGYRLELLDDSAVPAPLGQADTTGALTAEVAIGNRAGLVGQVRVATLPASGPGAVWSELQPVTIPGAPVTLSLAAVTERQSPAGLSFTVRQVQPVSSTALVLAPGDSAKRLGTGPVAAFSAERSEPLQAGAELLRRLSYTVDSVQSAISLSAPLDYDWPTPSGTTRTIDWALVLPGLPPLWHASVSAKAMASRLMDSVAAEADRVAIASALDAAIAGSSLLSSLLVQSHDSESLAAALAPADQSPAQRVAALRPRFADAGLAIDCGTLARLIGGSAPETLADALDPVSRTDGDAVETLAAALRAAGLSVAQAAAQLHRLRPELDATALAQALVAAFYATSAAAAYALQLTARGLPVPIVATRTARLASGGAAMIAVDGLTLLCALLRSQGKSVRDAAIHARAALPQVTADTMAAALVAAYYQDPRPLQVAAVALAGAFGADGSAGAQQRLAWSLALAGVAPSDLSPLVDSAFALAPDDGSRAAALSALFASSTVDLAGAGGSPMAAAGGAALGALSAGARLIVLADAYRGLALDPSLVAACLALGGSASAEAQAAIAQLLAGVDPARSAAAWADGQALIAQTSRG
ncbi:MAG TPA: hypothetical protein VF652_04760, partial [Allosphingosinicella sp.]